MAEEPKKKVLMVEDDEMLVEIYQRKLLSEAYELIIARDGKEALEKTQKLKPNLVLLDLVMPEMDGFEALQKIKGDPETKDIKVVVASNLSQEDEKKKARDLGADDFIIKSNYDLTELTKKIESYL